MRAVSLLLAASTLAAIPLAAQDGRIVIRAGTLLDGTGGTRRNVDVVIADGRIELVGPSNRGADYDLSGYTVLPGGIDTHVHINWHFDPDGRTHHLGRDEESPQQAALYAVENAYATLMGGVTTVQSLGSTVDADVRDFVARGIIPGPRILTSLRAISNPEMTPAEMRDRVRELHGAGADVIKIFASASIRVGGTPTLSQEQLDAACGEATRLGLRTAVHAHGPESAQRAVRAGCTVIEHGALLDQETLSLMAARGTYYDPNIHLIFRNYFENRDRYIGIGSYTAEGFAQMEQAVPRALEVFQWALETPGLEIVFGTDAVAGAHGRNVEELIYRVERGGQSGMDAVVSGTSRAATSLGLGNEIGTLAPGYRADLIATDGNPAEDITALRRVVFVMRDGRIYRNDAGR